MTRAEAQRALMAALAREDPPSPERWAAFRDALLRPDPPPWPWDAPHSAPVAREEMPYRDDLNRRF